MRRARVVMTIKNDVLDRAHVQFKNTLTHNGLTTLPDVRIGIVLATIFCGGNP